MLNAGKEKSRPLKQDILNWIRSGEIQPENRLPSIQNLAERYHLSYVTVQKALAELEREGYLLRRNGVGVFVRKQEKRRDIRKLAVPLRLNSNPVFARFYETIADTATAGSIPFLFGSPGEDEVSFIRKAAAGPDAENYYTLYHLALNYYCRNDFERAEQYLRRSLALRKSRWALHALANVFRVTGRLKECAALFRDLVRDYGTDLSLVKEAFKNFSEAGAYAEALEAYYGLPDASKVPLVRFFYAEALAHSGNLAEAEDILLADGGIEVPDIREGENSTSAVYLYIQKEKARRLGKILRDDEIEIPFSMDLRMTVPDPRRKQQ